MIALISPLQKARVSVDPDRGNVAMAWVEMEDLKLDIAPNKPTLEKIQRVALETGQLMLPTIQSAEALFRGLPHRTDRAVIVALCAAEGDDLIVIVCYQRVKKVMIVNSQSEWTEHLPWERMNEDVVRVYYLFEVVER